VCTRTPRRARAHRNVYEYTAPMRRIAAILPWLVASGLAACSRGRESPSAVATGAVEELALARVAGVVVAGGRPLAGASVRLEYRDRRPQPAEIELEDVRPRTWQIGRGRTDAVGAFSFPTTGAGEMRLSASHEEHGEASRDVDVESERGAIGIVLELDRPLGTIEGRVIPPSDRAAGDLLLAFAGPGDDFYMAPDAAGWFRARGLESGTWAIRVMPNRGEPHAMDPEEKRGFSFHSWPVAPDWLAEDASWLVELADGETRTIEVDLTTPRTCRLAGSVRVDGEPLAFGDPDHGFGYWPTEDRHAFLEMPHPARAPDHVDVARDQLGADGRFELAAREPGVYRVRLELCAEGGPSWTILDRARLEPGEVPWSLDLRSGSVRVRTDDAELTKLLADHVRYRWRGPGEIRALLLLRPSPEDGAYVLRGLPAGRGELYQDLPDERRVLARFEVEAGTIRDVELP
jgi:hypothetical protein